MISKSLVGGKAWYKLGDSGHPTVVQCQDQEVGWAMGGGLSEGSGIPDPDVPEWWQCWEEDVWK